MFGYINSIKAIYIKNCCLDNLYTTIASLFHVKNIPLRRENLLSTEMPNKLLKVMWLN
jgi:hypothetical protein